MAESPQIWKSIFLSSCNGSTNKLQRKAIDAAKHGGYGHASALAGLVLSLEVRDDHKLTSTYKFVKEFVNAGTATKDLCRAVLETADGYLEGTASDQEKKDLLTLLFQFQGLGLADTEVLAPLLQKHRQSNVPMHIWAKVFRLLGAAQKGDGVDDALQAIVVFNDPLISDCILMLAKSCLSSKAVMTSLFMIHNQISMNVTKGYIEKLVLLPDLGFGSNFTEHITDTRLDNQTFFADLAVFLDMKDVRYHCRLLRSLQRHINCLPSLAWLRIVDFVGLYNPSNSHHALAHAAITAEPTVPNTVEKSSSRDTEKVALVSPALANHSPSTVGLEPNVIQDIQHDEPAASILPEDAAWTQDEVRNSLIQSGLTFSMFGDVAIASGGERVDCQSLSVQSVAPSSNAYQECVEEHGEKQGLASEHVASCIAEVRDANYEHTVGLNCGESRYEFSPHNAQTEAGHFVLDPLDDPMAQPHLGIQSFPTIQLLNFTRHPKAFEEMLMNNEDLRETREGLARSGLEIKLMDGTKVFTSPNEYKAAMDAIKGMRLGPSYVIASDAVVPVVIAAVNQVPRKEHVRIRARQTLAIMDHSGEAAVAVRQTFLCEVRSFNDDSVTSSTTQAHRGGKNPRAHSYPK